MTRLAAFLVALLLAASPATAGWVSATPVGSATQGEVKVSLSRYLDVDGDGTGNEEATGDYSSAEEIFYIQPAAGQIFRITRLLVSLSDAGVIAADGYGAMSALTNGILVHTANDSGELINLTDAEMVKTSAGWSHHSYDVQVLDFGLGQANEHLVCRWTFSKSGTVIRLVGDDNERLEVVLNDSFTGLLHHSFLVQGYIE